jgi:NitT/TauT family transport system substrate-binding protein
MNQILKWTAAASFVIAADSFALETVAISDLGIVADAPVYMAIDKGYFKERGIQVKLLRFASAAETTAALTTGDLQFSGGAVSAGLFNAFARGWPVRIVLSRTRDLPGFSSNTMVVRSDLKDQIRSLADLKGRKIAVNAPAAGLVYMLGNLLESERLGLKDVDVVYMPWPNMAPAFEKKAIDAGMMVEPFVAQFHERGQAFPFKRAADHFIKTPLEISVILVNKEWMDGNFKLASEFTVAYFKGLRYVYDAMMGGKNRSEVIDVVSRRTGVKDRALFDRMQWSYMDPNGRVARDSLLEQQDWHARHGSIPKKVSIDEIVDDRLARYAIGQLGVATEKRP